MMLANMRTKLLCCTKMTSSEDSIVETDADAVAQGLQRMAEDGITDEYRRTTMTASNRRRTVYELTQSPLRKIGNFEKLFRRTLRNPNLSGLSEHISSRMSKGAFSAFERRRSTILVKRKKPQAQKPYDIYDDANSLRRSSDTQLPTILNANQFQYDNPGFRQDENV